MQASKERFGREGRRATTSQSRIEAAQLPYGLDALLGKSDSQAMGGNVSLLGFRENARKP